jgi:UDP-2,3-diacylglucosamine hydrolase
MEQISIVGPMRDIFIADAHLLDPAEENYQRLMLFLEDQRGKIRTLYLLGDIFEFWVGFRHVVFTPYVPLLEALRQLRKSGTAIVYVEGNHDFHMGPYFEQILDCQVLADGGTIDLDGLKVFIGHGDLVNPRDFGYRFLRFALRTLPLRTFMRFFPPDWTWSIARWGGRKSRRLNSAKQKQDAREMILDHARRHFAAGYVAVITGHFHSPMFAATGEGTVIALGDWIRDYSYAVYEDGVFSLHQFRTFL